MKINSQVKESTHKYLRATDNETNLSLNCSFIHKTKYSRTIKSATFRRPVKKHHKRESKPTNTLYMLLRWIWSVLLNENIINSAMRIGALVSNKQKFYQLLNILSGYYATNTGSR